MANLHHSAIMNFMDFVREPTLPLSQYITEEGLDETWHKWKSSEIFIQKICEFILLRDLGYPHMGF